jgi:PknH-like extracellular domain
VNVNYRGDTHTLTAVGVADSVLSANARLSSNSSTIPEARVVGIRVNCLVEVEVSYFSSYGRTPDERKSDAIAIAHRMMDNVSDLS